MARSTAKPLTELLTKPSQTEVSEYSDTLVSTEEELALLSTYRRLSATEQDRVYHFAQDAFTRDQSPDLAARYVPLEFLQTFLGQQAEFYAGKQSRADLCRFMDLTRAQYFRLATAWEKIKSVSEAVEEFMRQAYGRGPEEADTVPPARPLPPGSVSVMLVTDGEGPFLFRHEPTGAYVLLLDQANPKRAAVEMLCGLLDREVKRRQ